MNWRPIEDAPRDGTPFWVYDRESGMVGIGKIEESQRIPGRLHGQAAWAEGRGDYTAIILGKLDPQYATHYAPIVPPSESNDNE